MKSAPGAVKRGLIEATVVKLLTHDAEVRGVEQLADRFRLISLGGDALRGRKWAPGETIQVMLGGWKHRSYTPLAWNASEGTTEFVAYDHGDGVAAAWSAALTIGERCNVFGPRDALKLNALRRPGVFFGDETSFGTSAALRATVGGLRDVTLMFEVASASEARAVLAKLGVEDAVLIEREADDGHLAALETQLLEIFRANSATDAVFTGKAGTIQRLYRTLRRAEVSGRQLKSHAYWSPGKQGLE